MKLSVDQKIWFPLIWWGIAILFALTYLLTQIVDPDFFWHLKTGEWLWQHHAWPLPDPFAFTTPEVLDQRQIFILKGYWLSQLLYYSCHAALGWIGIYFLRLAVFAVFVWVLWRNRQGDNWLWFGFSLACLVTIFGAYPVERPQFFSFLLFAWLYLLLDGFWSGVARVSRRHLWAVGVVMMLWGNLHGGVILGQGLLLITLAIDLLSLFRRNRVTTDNGLSLWSLAVVGILAGCLNPNISRMVFAVSQTVDTSSLMYASTEEFASVFRAWQGTGRPLVLIFAAVAALVLIALFHGLRRQSLFSLLILVGTGVYAAKHIRYIPFFLLAALPILARGFAEMPLLRYLRSLVFAGALLFTVVFAWDKRGNLGRVRSEGWVSNQDFPVLVAEQVLTSGIDGRLFNIYLWGGYLLWRLGPERQVFVDGRALDARIVRDALTAEMVSFGGGRMIWKEVFEKHRITYAILPKVKEGEPYRLTQTIAMDPDWQVAFASGNAVLLIKR